MSASIVALAVLCCAIASWLDRRDRRAIARRRLYRQAQREGLERRRRLLEAEQRGLVLVTRNDPHARAAEVIGHDPEP